MTKIYQQLGLHDVITDVVAYAVNDEVSANPSFFAKFVTSIADTRVADGPWGSGHRRDKRSDPRANSLGTLVKVLLWQHDLARGSTTNCHI